MIKQSTLSRVRFYQSEYDLDINYGLCPNPNGFTFIDNEDAMSPTMKSRLSLLLDELTVSETQELRNELY